MHACFGGNFIEFTAHKNKFQKLFCASENHHSPRSPHSTTRIAAECTLSLPQILIKDIPHKPHQRNFHARFETKKNLIISICTQKSHKMPATKAAAQNLFPNICSQKMPSEREQCNEQLQFRTQFSDRVFCFQACIECSSLSLLANNESNASCCWREWWGMQCTQIARAMHCCVPFNLRNDGNCCNFI
jgi:hypothetical protein